MKNGGRVLVICWALLLSLLFSGCFGYSSEYVEDLQREINKLEEENAELESELEYRIEAQYGRFVADLETAWQEFHDPDDMLYRLEEINGSYDARQIVDGPYRQAFDAFSDLFFKYYDQEDIIKAGRGCVPRLAFAFLWAAPGLGCLFICRFVHSSKTRVCVC